MTPRICFLGLYERMVQITTASGMPIAVNMLGLTDQVVSTLYPLSFAGLGLALAIFEPSKKKAITLIFREQVTQHQLEITMNAEIIEEVNPEATSLGHVGKSFWASAKKSNRSQTGAICSFCPDKLKRRVFGIYKL